MAFQSTFGCINCKSRDVRRAKLRMAEVPRLLLLTYPIRWRACRISIIRHNVSSSSFSSTSRAATEENHHAKSRQRNGFAIGRFASCFPTPVRSDFLLINFLTGMADLAVLANNRGLSGRTRPPVQVCSCPQPVSRPASRRPTKGSQLAFIDEVFPWSRSHEPSSWDVRVSMSP